MIIPDRWSVGVSPESEIMADCRARSRGQIRRIGVQYDTFGCGGAERVAAELIKLFVELGYEVTLYLNVKPDDDNYSLPESVVQKVMPSENYDHEERFAFWKKEVEEGLDICIYNSWVSGWVQFDCWALKSLGSLFVYYTHNVFTSWFNDPISDYLSRALPWVASRADAVVAINRATAEFFRLYSDSVMLLANPVDRYLKAIPESRYEGRGKNVVWVGRISDEKRPYEAVQIMAEVCKDIPEAHMYFIGGNDDPDKGEPANIARYAYENLGLSEQQITFTGFDSPYDYLRKADVYLQTSEYEGFPLTLAEAMRFGIPCACYRLDYLSLLESGHSALMANIGDTKTLSRAVVSLLDNEDKRAEMSRAAYDTYDKVCRVDLLSVWRRVLDDMSEGALSDDLKHQRCADGSCERINMDLVLQKIGLLAASRKYEERCLARDMETIEGRIEQLGKELEHARKELDEIKQSKAYRLGEAIASPVRKVKRS